MSIPPQESQTSSQQRNAEHGQLPGIGNEGNLEVACCFKIARDIDQHGISCRHGCCAAGREPVESVCQVYCVGCAYDDEEVENKCQCPHAQQKGFFEEWDEELLCGCGQFGICQEVECENTSQKGLEAKLEAAADAVRTFLRNLQPVVVKTDSAEENRAEKNKPHKGVFWFCPQEC